MVLRGKKEQVTEFGLAVQKRIERQHVDYENGPFRLLPRFPLHTGDDAVGAICNPVRAQTRKKRKRNEREREREREMLG